MNRYGAALGVCSWVFQVPEDVLEGKGGDSEVREARNAIWLILRLSGEFFADIADEYDRHRTTVMSGVEYARNQFKEDPWYREQLELAWANFKKVTA